MKLCLKETAALEARVKTKTKMDKRSHLYKLAIAIVLSLALFISGCADETIDKYALFDQAISLYEAGDYEGAIEGFDAALDATRGKVSEFQYDILRYRAECELITGDYSAAKNTYNALLQLDDSAENQDRYNELLAQFGDIDALEDANQLFNDGDYQAAYDRFSEMAALDGSLSGRVAWFDQAVCAEYLGDYSDAYALLERFIEEYPDDEKAVKEAEFCRSRSSSL